MLNRIFASLTHGEEIEIKAKRRENAVEGPNFLQRRFKSVSEAESWAKKADGIGYDVYFGCALRRAGGSSARCDLSRATILWSDNDHTSARMLSNWPLPPTWLVGSGTGQHCFWLLDSPFLVTEQKQLELYLHRIAQCVGGDLVTTDACRVLRIPGTRNHKYDPVLPVTLVDLNDVSYSREDITAAWESYSSGNWLEIRGLMEVPVAIGNRSEWDWRIICALIREGFSDTAINVIYSRYMPDDAKGRLEPDYLEQTIMKANQQISTDSAGLIGPPNVPPVESQVERRRPGRPKKERTSDNSPVIGIEKGEGFYFQSQKEAVTYLSNFVMDVIAIRDSMLIVDIRIDNTVRRNVAVPSTVFSTSIQFCNWIPFFEMVWLGKDDTTRRLKQLLYLEWKQNGSRSMHVTNALGRQYLNDVVDVLVTNQNVYNPDLTNNLNVVYTEPSWEHPKISLGAPTNPSEVLNAIKQVNRTRVIAPMLGWFVLAHCKPVLEKIGIRFPHLIVYGTRGAGKTTLITRVFQPLSLYTESMTWQSNSTPFVMLSLLSSTTSVPICLTEFRESTQRNQGKFLQLLRTIYDTGHDARGHADQTTTTYNLTAPICVDGEENVTDPALLERVISVYLDVRDVKTHSDQLEQLLTLPISAAGAAIAEHCLTITPSELSAKHATARELIQQQFSQLAERIQNNYASIIVGLSIVNDIVGSQLFPINSDTIQEYFGIEVAETTAEERGRTRLDIDNFLESVVNHILTIRAEGARTEGVNFRYMPEKDGPIMGFHLKTAYDWWRSQLMRQKIDAPNKGAVAKQLSEMEGGIIVDAHNCQSQFGRVMRMYFIDLEKATQSGLDIDQF